MSYFVPEEYKVLIRQAEKAIIDWARPKGWPESDTSVSMCLHLHRSRVALDIADSLY